MSLGPGAYGTSAYGTVSYGGNSGASENDSGGAPVLASGTDLITFTSTATAKVVQKATALDTITFTSTASSTWRIKAQTWTYDDSQKAKVSISSYASAKVETPVDIPVEFGVQVISVDATGGSFTITLLGETTAPIIWNSSASALQSSLESLPAINPGDVIVSGGDGGPWILTYMGQFSGNPIPTATLNTTGLTGGASTGISLIRPKLFIKRISISMPTPALNSRGQPI